MQIVVKGKNYSVADRVRERIQEKISRLSRHLEHIGDAVVEVSRERTRSQEDRYVVQATLHVNSTLLRAEERGADIFKALDTVVDVLDRQIERYKGRLSSKQKVSALRPVETVAEEAAGEPEEPSGKILRTKRFQMKPMAEDEAVEQMELLGHDFFVFHNSVTNLVNVLYKRADGNYGLIVPELG